MGLRSEAPSAWNLELPGTVDVTSQSRLAAECVGDFELRTQQGGVTRKLHAFFAFEPSWDGVPAS
jgi:hypothetical protein